MDLEFGKSVYEESRQLAKEAKDANQIAKILCDQDLQGHNYGIGILLDNKGQALGSSSLLQEYVSQELQASHQGKYMNSANILNEMKAAVLRWQRIPRQYWDQFILALPSDAGTGAVKTAIELSLQLDPQLKTIGIEAIGWPAYKAIAKVTRLACEEFDEDSVCDGEKVLPIYQAGPMNTTGRVRGADVIRARVNSAADKNLTVVLDRAYPGFEFAHLYKTHSFDQIMSKSYQLQIRPFIEAGVPFVLAISPTKAFVTFALRPGGLVLYFCPEHSRKQEVTNLLNMILRARGSAFENPVTRAFVKAMVYDFARIEIEHHQSLKRLHEAESLWRKLVKSTAIESLYSNKYAGMFRNPPAKSDAAIHIYNAHLYPVFSQGRCRQNVTGIPADEQLARKHVAVFAEHCSSS